MDSEEQKQRAILRDRFLRLLKSLNGRRSSINMHEKTKVEATFLHANIEFDHVMVADLESPIGRLPRAVLRSSDIVSMDFEIA